jgi:hypothetical protein
VSAPAVPLMFATFPPSFSASTTALLDAHPAF